MIESVPTPRQDPGPSHKRLHNTHFSSLASTLPVSASITPTYRTTFPSRLASSRNLLISSSPSASRSRYSSLDPHEARTSGTSDEVGTEA